MPRRPRLRTAAAASVLTVCCSLSAPTIAMAGDFDRNELSGRELSAGFAAWPDDMDLRPSAPCSSTSKVQCVNQSLGVGPIVRGAARRHRGNLYVASEAVVGVRLPDGQFSAFPVLGVGAGVGWETAADSYKRLRGYGEFGLGLVYGGTRVSDLLKVHLEAGLRYRVQTYERPHTYLHIGVRAMTNFAHVGAALAAGVGWAFD